MTKFLMRVGAVAALMLGAGSLAYAMDEQHVVVPAPAAAGVAAQPSVQAAPPAAKPDAGTEIRIPGLGKLGTLPKMDFGLELLYGAADNKPAQDPVPDDKDNQDLTIRGTVKHNF